MPLEEGREYFSNGSFFTILKRGFRLFRKTFAFSIVAKLLLLLLAFTAFYFLTILSNNTLIRSFLINSYSASFNWWKEIITTVVSIFIFFTIYFFGEGIIAHSLGLSINGKISIINSLKHSVRNVSSWFLLSIIYLCFVIVGFLIWGLFTLIWMLFVNLSSFNIPNGISIFLSVILLIFVLSFFDPIIYFVAIRDEGFGDYLNSKNARKNYGKILLVYVLAVILLSLITFIFFIVISSFYNVKLGNVFYLMEKYLIIDIVYLIILSVLLAFFSNLKIALCSSIIGREREKEDAEKDKIVPIEENLNTDVS